MNVAEIFTLVTDVVMSEMGDDGTYYPIVGEPVAVRVFIRRNEPLLNGLGVTGLRSEGRLLEIRKSDLLIAPQAGDAINIGGEFIWRVRSAHSKDAAEVVWILDCVPA